jgi:uncharacterized protein YecE (DUF72 family)
MLALAPLRERLGELASRNIFVGTSSWKYEGWLGQLYSPVRYEYRGKIAKTRFEAECLSEYADIFRTVCVDAGFYRFPDEKYIGNLASQVPDGFLLSFKATNDDNDQTFSKSAAPWRARRETEREFPERGVVRRFVPRSDVCLSGKNRSHNV